MPSHTFILQHTENDAVYEYAFDIWANKWDSILSVQMKAISIAKMRIREAEIVPSGDYPCLMQLEDDLSLRLLSGPDALLVRG